MSDFRFRRSGCNCYEVLTRGPRGKRLGYVSKYHISIWTCGRDMFSACWSNAIYQTRNEAAEALRKAVKRGD